MAEPEVVPPLPEGVPDLQQAGADAAPVVLAKRLPLDLLPRVAGEDPVVVEGGDEVVPRRVGVVQPVLQGVPVGVNVAGQRFYYVHLLPSARVAKFQRCTDQQRQDYPESA